MNSLPILNRDFQHPTDGWYHIEALGEHPNREAGITQVIDAKAAGAIVAAFKRQADDPNFPGLLVDHEHFRHDLSQESVAYGWLQRLDNRADGIYGQIRWTGTGKPAVDGGDYRFFSTEYPPSALEPADPADKTRVRPTRLGGLTLTNCNNNKGQKPITNRTPEQFPPGDPVVADKRKNEPASMSQITKLLKLPDGADETAIAAGIQTVLNRSLELETTTQRQLAAQVEEDLETYKDRIPTDSRDYIKGMLVANREAGVKFLKSLPKLPGATAPARVHNREAAGAPGNPLAATDDQGKSFARKQAVDECKRQNPAWTYEKANNWVRNRNPELFGLPARNNN